MIIVDRPIQFAFVFGPRKVWVWGKDTGPYSYTRPRVLCLPNWQLRFSLKDRQQNCARNIPGGGRGGGEILRVRAVDTRRIYFQKWPKPHAILWRRPIFGRAWLPGAIIEKAECFLIWKLLVILKRVITLGKKEENERHLN